MKSTVEDVANVHLFEVIQSNRYTWTKYDDGVYQYQPHSSWVQFIRKVATTEDVSDWEFMFRATRSRPQYGDYEFYTTMDCKVYLTVLFLSAVFWLSFQLVVTAGDCVLGSSGIPFCKCSLSVHINCLSDSCHLVGPDHIKGKCSAIFSVYSYHENSIQWYQLYSR